MPVERELVTLTARDGEGHDALLHRDYRGLRARARRTGRRTAVLHVHGIMGNFLVGTLRFLPAPLARAGFPTLVVETRMGNVGQLFGQAILDDALLDLDAAAAWLEAQGYDHLVLSGYSSGATLATRFAALRDLPHLRGLVGLGTPWSLPAAAERRSKRWGAEPAYEELATGVKAAVAADADAREPDRLFKIERSLGPSRRPADCEVYTWRTWWHSRGPDATSAMTFRHIGRVPAPVLLVQGTTDTVVDPTEAEALAQEARRAGNREVVVRPIEAAGHTFAGREFLTTEAVVRWLREVA